MKSSCRGRCQAYFPADQIYIYIQYRVQRDLIVRCAEFLFQLPFVYSYPTLSHHRHDTLAKYDQNFGAVAGPAGGGGSFTCAPI